MITMDDMDARNNIILAFERVKQKTDKCFIVVPQSLYKRVTHILPDEYMLELMTLPDAYFPYSNEIYILPYRYRYGYWEV